jgi:hypothetical protein
MTPELKAMGQALGAVNGAMIDKPKQPTNEVADTGFAIGRVCVHMSLGPLLLKMDEAEALFSHVQTKLTVDVEIEPVGLWFRVTLPPAAPGSFRRRLMDHLTELSWWWTEVERAKKSGLTLEMLEAILPKDGGE